MGLFQIRSPQKADRLAKDHSLDWKNQVNELSVYFIDVSRYIFMIYNLWLAHIKMI